MARIPYVDPETAAPAVREVFALLPVRLNIFKLMAHAETCFRAWIRLGSQILGKQKLSGKLRELAILRVARLSGAVYEWVQHVPIALRVGVSQAQVVALERGDATAECFDETERLLLRFTDEVVRDVGASRATHDALARHLSPQELVELVLAIGFYMTVARLMQSFEIDLDSPQGERVLDAVSR